MESTDYATLSPGAKRAWARSLVEQATPSKLIEMVERAQEEARWNESIRRRNAMVRLFLARWGAIEALRSLRDPPDPAPISFNRWRRTVSQ